MSENALDADKDRDVPTPDWFIPGITDLSTLDEGEQITLESRATPLTVEQVGVRRMTLATGDDVLQHAVAAVCNRTGRSIELIEQINVADGATIEIVDSTGSPVRVFEVDSDE